MFASDALVWVISTASACGRRAEDRLRGPVAPLARPVLLPADKATPEALISGLMLRDTMMASLFLVAGVVPNNAVIVAVFATMVGHAAE